MRFRYIIAILVLINIIAGCQTSKQRGIRETSPTQSRSFAGTLPAPEFPAGLDWLNTGRPLTLAELKGKVVILDFWTYGCINCMHIIPDLKQLEDEYPDELVVIGVHSAKFTNESITENIRQIILRYDLEHPVINDRDFTVWRIWGARAWPTLVLIDPAGRYVGHHSGEGVYILLKPVIDSLIQEFDEKGILERRPINFKLEKENYSEHILSFPGKVLTDERGGRLFISDSNHNRIVVADIQNGRVIQIIGQGNHGFKDGTFRSARFHGPQGMALSHDGTTLYIADTKNHSIREADLLAKEVSTLVGTGEQSLARPPMGGRAPDVVLISPWDIELDGNKLYIAMAGSHQIWLMDLEDKSVEAYVGNGYEGTSDNLLDQATLAQPSGLALDGMGRLYFADSESSSIRWAETESQGGRVGTLAGGGATLFDFGDQDGTGREAKLQHPLGVVFHEGNVWVADTYNNKIKQIDPDTGEVRTFAGSVQGFRDGDDPLFYEPGGIDVAFGLLYVADTNNHRIRVIDLKTRKTETFLLTGFISSAFDVDAKKVVRLAPIEGEPGQGRIVIDLQFPRGYKLTPKSFSSIEIKTENEIMDYTTGPKLLQVKRFPVEFDTFFREGSGQVSFDMSIVFCARENEALCYFEEVRLIAPLTIRRGGKSVLRFHYTVEEPVDTATLFPTQ